MKKKVKKKKYQKPEIEVIAVEPSHFFCVSGTINECVSGTIKEWSVENDESDDDDWGDDNSNNSSNNSKKSMWNNLWEK